MTALAEFLDRVIEHLANRTTARERVTYHLAESYARTVLYDTLQLPESDSFYGKGYRALPPAEEMVLVAWYNNAAQLELAQDEAGFTFLGGAAARRISRTSESRDGASRHHANAWKRCRTGLLNLREPGFRVFTRSSCGPNSPSIQKAQGLQHGKPAVGNDDDEIIYAFFSQA